MHTRDLQHLSTIELKSIATLLNELLSNSQKTLEAAKAYAIENQDQIDHLRTNIGFNPHSSKQQKAEAYFVYALSVNNINKLEPEILKYYLQEMRNDHKYDRILAKYLALEAKNEAGSKELKLPNTSNLGFQYAELNDTSILNKHILYINLENAHFENGYMDHSTLPNSNLKNLSAPNSKWQYSNLTNSDLSNMQAPGSQWIQTDLAGCNITDINLKDATLEDINFFSTAELENETNFQTALDRWHRMMNENQQHPQLALIRKAMKENLLDKFAEVSDAALRSALYKLAYQHPVISEHRNFTIISSAINTLFSSKDKAALETSAQKTIREGIKNII